LYAYGNPTVYVDLYGYANVSYLDPYDDSNRHAAFPGDEMPNGNLLKIEFDGPADLASGIGEVVGDGADLTIEAVDGGVDFLITSVGGTKDLALAISTLPAVIVERSVIFTDLGTLPKYLGTHLEVAYEGYRRRWRFSREADLLGSAAFLGQEVPLIGNFIPGAKGNMNGNLSLAISGGVNADNQSISMLRDGYTLDSLISMDTNNNKLPQQAVFADNVRDTGTRVLLSLLAGYRSRGIEAAEQIVDKVDRGSTIEGYAHSGGVSRMSVASNYIAAFDIGVKKLAADQGPGFGLYNNIESLQATYSIGLREPTSDLGAGLFWGYWSTGKTDHTFVGSRQNVTLENIIGDPHRQLGNPKDLDPTSNEIGNENSRLTYDFLAFP